MESNNRVESVIVWVINKIRGLGRRITSAITDRIGLHKVLLPINQNYDKIWERN